jgi:hypothetical protein
MPKYSVNPTFEVEAENPAKAVVKAQDEVETNGLDNANYISVSKIEDE